MSDSEKKPNPYAKTIAMLPPEYEVTRELLQNANADFSQFGIDDEPTDEQRLIAALCTAVLALENRIVKLEMPDSDTVERRAQAMQSDAIARVVDILKRQWQ